MTPSSRAASSTREVSSRIRLRARRQTTTRRTRRRAPGRPRAPDCGLRQTAQRRTRHRVAQRRTRRSALRSRRSLPPTCAPRATSLPPHPARASCSYSSPLRPSPLVPRSRAHADALHLCFRSGSILRARSVVTSVTGSSLSKVNSATSATSQRRAADAGSNPRAHARAERILASAFDTGSRPASGRNGPAPHGSYLEGGAQKAHDPSRTAEGAVKAMYEQREKQEQDEKEEDEAAAEEESGLEAERLVREQEEFQARDRWSGRRREGSDGSSAGRSAGSDDLEGDGLEMSGGRGLGLKALLTPVWRYAHLPHPRLLRSSPQTDRLKPGRPQERQVARAHGRARGRQEGALQGCYPQGA